MITVDCGVTSLEPLAEARKLAARCGRRRPSSGRRKASRRCGHQSIQTAPMICRALGALAAVGLVFLTLVAVIRELPGAI